MTNMDVFLTGVPAGAIGVSDGFEEDSSPSARTIVLNLTAAALWWWDGELDDVFDDCLREAFIIFDAPVKKADVCGAVCVKLIIVCYYYGTVSRSFVCVCVLICIYVRRATTLKLWRKIKRLVDKKKAQVAEATCRLSVLKKERKKKWRAEVNYAVIVSPLWRAHSGEFF